MWFLGFNGVGVVENLLLDFWVWDDLLGCHWFVSFCLGVIRISSPSSRKRHLAASAVVLHRPSGTPPLNVLCYVAARRVNASCFILFVLLSAL